MGGKDSLEEWTVSFFMDGLKFRGNVFGRVYFRELSNSFSFKLPEDCRVFQVEVASIKVIVASKCDPLPC